MRACSPTTSEVGCAFASSTLIVGSRSTDATSSWRVSTHPSSSGE
jgi:hypothetical protein